MRRRLHYSWSTSYFEVEIEVEIEVIKCQLLQCLDKLVPVMKDMDGDGDLDIISTSELFPIYFPIS